MYSGKEKPSLLQDAPKINQRCDADRGATQARLILNGRSWTRSRGTPSGVMQQSMNAIA